ncbi:ABC transporter ATP-binding protein [Diaphorobacter ruginosibacter]|uniref:ABC transporter ATP-binding protein n=1 Tax=Diaphorobacter ruginosibacter TaxID=1715720 RepID=A0A7G9RT16_9BURK|nr:ABC transporter ATP-binding protein [Diaphorobacter ruginosibacter]QNN58741.1 ABC transporter ATP-binding protein [Diaphorobacter ruginosibacter]
MRTLEVKDIVVHYGLVEALHGVSFRIDAGRIVALIGSNGAGKSTTLKALMGLKKLTSGSLMLDGHRIDGTHSAQRVGMGIALSPEGRRLFPRMSVWENLMVGAHTVGSAARRSQSLDLVYELFPRVKERCQQMAGSLSGGEQQMVAIGRAMMSSPQILMLDEPSLGIAPKIVSEIAQAIRRLNQETGISVILVEQNARLALKMSDDAYVFEQGLVIRSGSGQELLNDVFVQKAFLGI